jgi:hypothetical protein
MKNITTTEEFNSVIQSEQPVIVKLSLYLSTIGSIHISIALQSGHQPASNFTITGCSL